MKEEIQKLIDKYEHRKSVLKEQMNDDYYDAVELEMAKVIADLKTLLKSLQ